MIDLSLRMFALVLTSSGKVSFLLSLRLFQARKAYDFVDDLVVDSLLFSVKQNYLCQRRKLLNLILWLLRIHFFLFFTSSEKPSMQIF